MWCRNTPASVIEMKINQFEKFCISSPRRPTAGWRWQRAAPIRFNSVSVSLCFCFYGE